MVRRRILNVPLMNKTNPLPTQADRLMHREVLAAVSFQDRVAICEPRLALSASAAADTLLETLAADPFADAAVVREQYSLSGTGQTVALIDSGIAWNHLAFANQKSGPVGGGFGPGHRVVGGWDFAENDTDPYDDGPAGYHGTHVAGTLGGAANGYSGIAPSADLVALRVFDDMGRGSLDWIESALRWVIDNRKSFDNPITTVNLSLGAFATDANLPLTQFDDELQTLREQGVIVFAAAGNSFDATRPDSLAYPASHPLVAAVTSIDASGTLHHFAQRGSGVFAAPGTAVRSSVPDHVLGVDGQIDDFAASDGTSMATPQLAGASVLVREAMVARGFDPTPEEILSHLRETAISRQDALTGAAYHQLDLQNAIGTLLGPGSTEPPVAPVPTEPSPVAPSPLLWSDATSLVIRTGDGSDNLVLDLSGQGSITINSVVHAIDRPFSSISIDGGPGNDAIEIIGSLRDERFIARAAIPGVDDVVATLQSPGFEGSFTSFETIVFRSGGGNDRATLFDSVGDDSFEANATSATLRGVGFSFTAVGVNNVYAHGTSGGSDIAFLYDSPQNDRLAIRHQFTSLRSDDLFRLAYGFEKVHAFAANGGVDHADLYDSPGDDRMSASAAAAWISGRDYYAGARGFHTIRAIATAGGNDHATLYCVDTSGMWTRSANLLQWDSSEGELRSAQGFARSEAFVGGSKVDVLPQSLRHAFFVEEREAKRRLFAQLDE